MVLCEKNELKEEAVYRTVGNTLENYVNWSEAGGKISDAKNFKNCVHPPILMTNDDRIYLDLIPPPQLHLMLGVVNVLFSNLLNECEEDALLWAKACNVQRDITHGSPSFNGNSCRILLKKLDLLRSRSKNIGCLKYIEVFKAFKDVVDACFSKILDTNFEDKIREFRNSYLELNISVTPKVHAVFYHVPEFCKKTQTGLGFYSEQVIESLHSDFKSVWIKHKVSSDHSEYSNRLLRAVCEYNGLHMS